MWGVEDRFVKQSVVAEHQWREVHFPVEGGVVDKGVQVFGDCFVTDFGTGRCTGGDGWW